MQPGYGFTRLTSDAVINEGHTLFGGLIINASVDGGDVSIYEGNDSSSGRLFDTFQGLAAKSEPIIFTVPIYFDRGLYVDIGSNVTSVTILWLPVDKELP